MSEPRNEKQLVNRIMKAIKDEWPEAWILKVHGAGYQRVGVPDLLVVVKGRLTALEVKHRKPGESEEHMLSRVTPVQEKEIRDIRKAGAVAGVVWTVEQALAQVRFSVA